MMRKRSFAATALPCVQMLTEAKGSFARCFKMKVQPVGKNRRHSQPLTSLLKSAGMALVFAWLGTTSPAQAAVIAENLSFSGVNYSATAQFTYDNATDALLSITGNVTAKNSTVTGGTITGLITTGAVYSTNPDGSTIYVFVPPGPSTNGFFYDNLFNPTTQTFTSNGILFAFGTGNYGTFYYGPTPFLSTWLPDGPGTAGAGYADSGPLYNPGDVGTLTFSAVAPVPEPSTWAMIILGFAAIGFVANRKNRLLHTS